MEKLLCPIFIGNLLVFVVHQMIVIFSVQKGQVSFWVRSISHKIFFVGRSGIETINTLKVRCLVALDFSLKLLEKSI